MELVLQQKQKQKLNLVMTTELRQAIMLLQYSTYELYQFIQEQQMENPLIELKERFYDRTPRPSSNRSPSFDQERQDPIDFMTREEEGMYDFLLEQASWLPISEQEQKTLRFLILNLDENGYLPLSTKEIATQLNISFDEVQQGLQYLHSLEPIGIGARHLAECLALQLKHYYPMELVGIKIVEEQLDLLAQKQWTELSERYDVPLSYIRRIFQLIQTLEPRPSTALHKEPVDYVNPDIIVRKEEGRYAIELNDDFIPEIHFNEDYMTLRKQSAFVASYINEQYKKYRWLISSIEQRRRTILKIVKAVINHQRDFLEQGMIRLKPLTLTQIAREINMHESTVSRATANKYIQTPQGTFSLRKLFATKLQGENGKSMSKTQVKLLLKEIIQQEDKSKPLSDQKISDYFKEEKGLSISRRTIAKYRGELKIPSSRQRKEVVL